MAECIREEVSPMKPYVSIVIPVYNEQDNLEALFTRLTAVMDDPKL